jgi:hypothetical protein
MTAAPPSLRSVDGKCGFKAPPPEIAALRSPPAKAVPPASGVVPPSSPSGLDESTRWIRASDERPLKKPPGLAPPGCILSPTHVPGPASTDDSEFPKAPPPGVSVDSTSFKAPPPEKAPPSSAPAKAVPPASEVAKAPPPEVTGAGQGAGAEAGQGAGAGPPVGGQALTAADVDGQALPAADVDGQALPAAEEETETARAEDAQQRIQEIQRGLDATTCAVHVGDWSPSACARLERYRDWWGWEWQYDPQERTWQYVSRTARRWQSGWQ